jgi:hypothetical protein
VLSGKMPPLHFYIDPSSKSVRIDRESGAKMFSFEALYEAIIEAVDRWTKSYSGDLSKQLEFIQRYDTVLSEGRLAKFSPKRVDAGDLESLRNPLQTHCCFLPEAPRQHYFALISFAPSLQLILMPTEPLGFHPHNPLSFLHPGLLPVRAVVAWANSLLCRRQKLLAKLLRTQKPTAADFLILTPPFADAPFPAPSGNRHAPANQSSGRPRPAWIRISGDLRRPGKCPRAGRRDSSRGKSLQDTQCVVSGAP